MVNKVVEWHAEHRLAVRERREEERKGKGKINGENKVEN